MSGPNALGDDEPQGANRYPTPTLEETRTAMNDALEALKAQARLAREASDERQAALLAEQSAAFGLFVDLVNLLADNTGDSVQITDSQSGLGGSSDALAFGARAATDDDHERELSGWTYLNPAFSWFNVGDGERHIYVDYADPSRDRAGEETAPALLHIAPDSEALDAFDVVLPNGMDARGLIARVLLELRRLSPLDDGAPAGDS